MPTESTVSRPLQSAQRQISRERGRSKDNVTKTPLACRTCRAKKVKCSGTIPCEYCQKRGIECVPRAHGLKRSFQVARIEELESRLARYEAPGSGIAPTNEEDTVRNGIIEASQLRDQHHSPSQTSNCEAVSHSAPRRTLAASTRVSTTLSSTTPKTTTSTHAQRSTITSDSSLSSSYTFGSRIHTLLDHAESGQHLRTSRASQLRHTSVLGGHIIRRPRINMTTAQIPTLPSEDNCQRLLEAVIFYIGQAQCHFDAREILDRLGYLLDGSLGSSHLETPEILATILVLAIGKLFVGEMDPSDRVPGTELFDFVLSNFPTLGELYALGRLGVELSALVAVYLQNSNRREEAYIYISTALRLAISHRFHRTSESEKFVQSEKVRLNRLWWTVYMQERRLSAATGSPSGINDEAIELNLPTSSPGFGPASPLCTNIKIGRVIGRIINGLYGKEPQTEQAFVSNAQDIVQTLHGISQEIPSELDTNSRNSESDLSLRTAAMLHLMLYQATILTIRPIMLHVTQLILENNLPSEENLGSTSLGKLTETCIEAARRMLKAIITLRRRGMIVIFGFSDLEAAFSAAVIMILKTIYNSACLDRERLDPAPGLNDALDVLQFLANKGNPFALQRLQEALRLWELTQTHLQRLHPTAGILGLSSEYGPSLASPPNHNVNVNDNATANVAPNYEQNPSNENLTTNSNTQGESGMMDMITLDSNLWDDISNLWAPQQDNAHGSSQSISAAASSLTEEPCRNFYSLYNNPQWPFVNDDGEEDIMELGKYLVDFGNY